MDYQTSVIQDAKSLQDLHARTAPGNATTQIHPCEQPPADLVFAVERLWFLNHIPVEHYVFPRPDDPVYCLPGNASPPNNLLPPQAFPANGDPHWRPEDTSILGKMQRLVETSWPVAYVRSGASTQPAPPMVRVVLKATPGTSSGKLSRPGSRWVRAAEKPGTGQGLYTHHAQVEFDESGIGQVDLPLHGLPSTVTLRSGLELTWEVAESGREYTPLTKKTKHTLFIVDATPKAGRFNIQAYKGGALLDALYFGCTWAEGAQGAAEVIQAIWKNFVGTPDPHPSGLGYWLTVDPLPEDDFFRAARLRRLDLGTEHAGRKVNASCTAFAQLFINCLAVHGIESAEVKVAPAVSTATSMKARFDYNGVDYVPTNKFLVPPRAPAQGNQALERTDSPHHWVVCVRESQGWLLYETSFGLGPFPLKQAPHFTEPAPNTQNHAPHPQRFEPKVNHEFIAPAAYEQQTVLGYMCTYFEPARGDDLTQIPSRNDDTQPQRPYLISKVLWTNATG
ncbi:hypothetical protein [Myxococcus vastator]|uniref:hypothetical protein n=1 Tax=Myxococcus vastator TaxID=2709664 RepID=UPI0013D093C5|nr:hypothetical protein [Myxococcus vastator]